MIISNHAIKPLPLLAMGSLDVCCHRSHLNTILKQDPSRDGLPCDRGPMGLLNFGHHTAAGSILNPFPSLSTVFLNRFVFRRTDDFFEANDLFNKLHTVP